MNGIKFTPADHWFSRCVRERANWKCEWCGTQYHEGDRGIECAHIFGRANKAVRLEPLNAFSLCTGCHAYFTANPMNFAVFVRNRLGDKYDILNELSNDIMRGKEYVQAIKNREAARHYKLQFETMQAKREKGFTGRIEFEGYI